MIAGAASGHRQEDGASATASAFHQLRQLMRAVPHLLSDRIELLALELERASRALARIVVLIVAAAVLFVTAWLAAWAVVLMGLVAGGMPHIPALMLVLVINAVAAWFALARARRLVGLLSLPATRRHLTVAAAKEPNVVRDVASPAQPPGDCEQAQHAQRSADSTRHAPSDAVPHAHDAQRHLAAGTN
jgi:Putative Actinobacterial Holin-X, holin superfamily III